MTIANEYRSRTHGVGARETFDNLAANSYRWNRRQYVPARGALELARRDAANGVSRYPSSLADGYGPRFEHGGESHCRWIENPAACGLRFVGYADDICESIRHRGWYTDDDGIDETMRGVVYQLPGRHGAPVFVYGYADPYNGVTGREYTNPALVVFDLAHGERGHYSNPQHDDAAIEAARYADSFAESCAESERDYRRASSARCNYESLGEQVADARRDILKTIRDAKADLDIDAATWRAVKDSVRRNLESICDARRARAELVSEHGAAPGWQDY